MVKKSGATKNIAVQYHRDWGFLFGLGVLFILLGCVGLNMVLGVTLASVFFLGVLFIIAGFVQLIDVFKCREWKGAFLHSCVAFLYIVAGRLVIHDPMLASTIITALIALILIVIGVTRLIMAFILRHGKAWGWTALAGMISLILGILILMQWPLSSLWFIGLFICIELMFNGWAYVFMALSLRKS